MNDSKKLTERRRRELLGEILRLCQSSGIGLVEPGEIDAMGMTRAVRTAFRRAADSLDPGVDLFLVDGLPVRGLERGFRYIVRGDSRSLCIAAASILAKVSRDRMMIEAEAEYPGYDFAANKGYGTPGHMEAIRRMGPCPIHRMSFSPMRMDPQLRLGL